LAIAANPASSASTSTGGNSPDGSTLMASTSGSLATSAGTWTFSAATGPGGNLILLNGQSAASGSAVELEIANQGQLYADNNNGQWWQWNGSGWTQTAAPGGASNSPTGPSSSSSTNPSPAISTGPST